jgi:hypothetical protein
MLPMRSPSPLVREGSVPSSPAFALRGLPSPSPSRYDIFYSIRQKS